MQLLVDQINHIVADLDIGSLTLESGEVLEHVVLRYERVGCPNAPVLLVCHALTGSHLAVGTSDNPGWWNGLIGKGKTIDPQHFFQIITFNVIGGCNGSSGPASINPKTGNPYRMNFPYISIRDMVHAQFAGLKKLGITKLAAVIGGSLGGMQAMEWGLLYPNTVEKLVILAATPALSDYGIAFNHIAATAIQTDPSWNGGNYEKGVLLSGLGIGRMIGMISYRSPDLFTKRFARKETTTGFSVTSYLDYQAKKLMQRFDANSYLYLLRAMNDHDIGRKRGGWKNAAKSYPMPILFLSYTKDLIYEPCDIQQFAEIVPNGVHHRIDTDYGHDGFLVEFEKWGKYIRDFL